MNISLTIRANIQKVDKNNLNSMSKIYDLKIIQDKISLKMNSKQFSDLYSMLEFFGLYRKMLRFQKFKNKIQIYKPNFSILK